MQKISGILTVAVVGHNPLHAPADDSTIGFCVETRSSGGITNVCPAITMTPGAVYAVYRRVPSTGWRSMKVMLTWTHHCWCLRCAGDLKGDELRAHAAVVSHIVMRPPFVRLARPTQ
jgi:hypothetical protein